MLVALAISHLLMPWKCTGLQAYHIKGFILKDRKWTVFLVIGNYDIDIFLLSSLSHYEYQISKIQDFKMLPKNFK